MAIVNLEEIKRLAAEVSAAHGIRLDPDDPMMAVVTLNRLVLEQVSAGLLKTLAEATRELNDAAGRVQVRAGAVMAEELKTQVVAARRELKIEASALAVPRKFGFQSQQRTLWLVVGLIAALALFGVGFYLGTLIG